MRSNSIAFAQRDDDSACAESTKGGDLATFASRQALYRYLARMEQQGIPRYLMACALLQSLRLGHAAGLTIGFVSLQTVVATDLHAILQQANYACPPQQRAGG